MTQNNFFYTQISHKDFSLNSLEYFLSGVGNGGGGGEGRICHKTMNGCHNIEMVKLCYLYRLKWKMFGFSLTFIHTHFG